MITREDNVAMNMGRGAYGELSLKLPLQGREADETLRHNWHSKAKATATQKAMTEPNCFRRHSGRIVCRRNSHHRRQMSSELILPINAKLYSSLRSVWHTPTSFTLQHHVFSNLSASFGIDTSNRAPLYRYWQSHALGSRCSATPTVNQPPRPHTSSNSSLTIPPRSKS